MITMDDVVLLGEWQRAELDNELCALAKGQRISRDTETIKMQIRGRMAELDALLARYGRSG